MRKEQNGKCPVCLAELGDEASIHVDHDHSCCPGMTTCGSCIRGLLCPTCNMGLGSLGDSVENLLRAASYLTLWSERLQTGAQ
jgi:hypothetical protein